MPELDCGGCNRPLLFNFLIITSCLHWDANWYEILIIQYIFYMVTLEPHHGSVIFEMHGAVCIEQP